VSGEIREVAVDRYPSNKRDKKDGDYKKRGKESVWWGTGWAGGRPGGVGNVSEKDRNELKNKVRRKKTIGVVLKDSIKETP